LRMTPYMPWCGDPDSIEFQKATTPSRCDDATKMWDCINTKMNVNTSNEYYIN
jgi:hypothetical protein